MTDRKCSCRMTEEEFQKQMDIATKLVNSWPLWKQNLLEQSSKPFVEVPREPVSNKDSDFDW